MQATIQPQAGHAAPSPYSSDVITKTPDWAGPTAWDIWFNNLSIGTFLVAVTGALLAPAAFGALARYALPLALVFLVIDLVLLVAGLGDPFRFHHMLRVFKPSSPMSFGTWALSLYGVLLGIASVAAVLSWPLFAGLHGWSLWRAIEFVGKSAAVLAIVPAAGGVLYKGPLFSITSQPGWKDARWFGAYLANSGILLGCSAVLLMALIGGQERAVVLLVRAMLALLVLDFVFLALLYRDVAKVYRQRYGVNQRTFIPIAVLAVGIALPFLLLAGNVLLAIPPALILAGGLASRYVFMRLPHGPRQQAAARR
jgi:hypothetical protein